MYIMLNHNASPRTPQMKNRGRISSSCGWNLTLECRPWVWGRVLVYFLQSPLLIQVHTSLQTLLTTAVPCWFEYWTPLQSDSRYTERHMHGQYTVTTTGTYGSRLHVYSIYQLLSSLESSFHGRFICMYNYYNYSAIIMSHNVLHNYCKVISFALYSKLPSIPIYVLYILKNVWYVKVMYTYALVLG